MFSPDQWAASTGVAFYNGVATQSLRFDDGSSAYLSRTPASAGNRKTWTWSGWVKRSNLGAGQRIFHASTDSNNRTEFYFTTADKLEFYSKVSSSVKGHITTNQVFRDVSAWYHFVFVLDASNTSLKIYANGSEITDLTTSTSIQNADQMVNSANVHTIGRYNPATNSYFDGYMADVNFIDGSALDPTSFGETKNGVWIPKQYTGSYGTNGFRLQFNQTGTGSASSSTIGADTSGNANHFSSSGIVASDCDMPDSPENNFPTLNPLSSTGITYQEGNLEMSGTPTYNAISTMGITEGKHYYEVLAFDNGSGGNLLVGIIDEDFLGTQGNLETNRGTYRSNGVITNLANTTQTSGSTYATGDFIGVAIDCDNGTVQFYKNNVAQGATPSFTFTAGTKVFANIRCDNATTIANANFGQDSSFCGNTSVSGNTDADGFEFKYTPPTGFKAICAKNLPEPTISPNADTQADDYFNTVIYSGNDDATRTFDVGFVSDFAWFKARNQTGYGHNLYDSVRGVQKYLQSNTTGAEITNTEGVTDFDDNGLLKIGTDAFLNESGTTMVIWNWKAGGTAVSNTDGSITSSVSANTDAGFSIVSYTGTGSSATIGHGLGSSPEVTIIKKRSGTENWYYQSEVQLGAWTYNLRLDTTQSRLTSSSFVTGVSDDTVSIATSTAVNGNGSTYIMYCFRSIEGYSKFGSYTGNDDPNGNMIFTNFTPALVIIKYVSGSAGGTKNWYMWDNTRSPQNTNDNILYSNDSLSEGADSAFDIDFLSNGFKLRNAEGGVNNGAEYIYMAWAKTPFKYANGR